MKQEQQKQESLTPQKIVQATIDEVYRIATEKENYDKEAILMSYAEFGCTPAYWQKQGKWEARKQIEAYLKSAQDQPLKALQEETIELNLNDFSVNMNDVEMAFAAGILCSGISVKQMAEMDMIAKFEDFKREYLDDKGYDPEIKSGEYIHERFQFADTQKTLQECKDEVALNKHQIPFENLFSKGQGRLSLILKVYDESAELYANQFKSQLTPSKKLIEFDRMQSDACFKTLKMVNDALPDVGEGWISVKDRLPEKTGNVLIYGSYTRDCPQRSMEALFVKKGNNPNYWYFSIMGIKSKNVTHWMKLPQPPK